MVRRFSRKLRHRFGSYQQQVNNLIGADGPISGANWPNTMSTTGNPWDLGAAPLYYSPSEGEYITSFDSNASPSASFEPLSSRGLGTVNLSNPNAFGRRRRSRRRSYKKSKRSHKRKFKFGSGKGCGCGS